MFGGEEEYYKECHLLYDHLVQGEKLSISASDQLTIPQMECVLKPLQDTTGMFYSHMASLGQATFLS